MRKSTVIKGLAGRFRKKNPPRKRKPKIEPTTFQIMASLQPATGAGLFIIAVIGAYLNYLAAADMLSAGMVLWQGKTAAATVAIAIGTIIMLFWTHVFELFPLVRGGPYRWAMLAVILLGCVMILCISCWMNAAALAGVRAQERDLAIRLSQYREAIDEVLRRAIVVRQLQPVLDAESARFAGMGKAEKESGALTGSRSPGAVTATLDQVSGRLTSLRDSVLGSLKEADEGAAQARKHLKAMQDLLGAQGEFDKRLSAFAGHAAELDAIMAHISEQSVLPAIRQTTQALDASLVLPATSGRSQELAAKQSAVMEGVAAAVREVGARLAGAAAGIEQHAPIELPPFMPLSRADAIVVYAEDFLPAWIAAISIDLMPLAIVFILVIVRASEEAQRNGAPARKPRDAGAHSPATPDPEEPEDFEKWLERRPGGLPGAPGPKGDLS